MSSLTSSAPSGAPAEAFPFPGFAVPTSNTTYCPNQFFDVCLPNSSRGCVRLVAYLLRKTLGWSDEHGRPQSERHRVSYLELIRKAGISRDMIRAATEEAIAGHFIEPIELRRRNSAGVSAVSAVYQLKWDERDLYLKHPREFRGFFAGEGNRTNIPNQFFDHVIRRETLAVIKTVGAVIRFSIGFQTKWGHRRQLASLSYQDIARYTHLRDRSTLATAIRTSIARNYVQRVQDGLFVPGQRRLSRPATYAIKWLNEATDAPNGRKTRPEKSDEFQQSEIPIGNGRKSRPDKRSEIQTDIQITDSNNTLKQKPAVAVAFERLKAEGFDDATAQRLASRHAVERIDRQIRWIDQRRVTRNRLGMLRSAIEQDWSAPGGNQRGRRSVSMRETGMSFADALQRAQERLSGESRSTSINPS